jgi:voltage-gated potassium channel
VPPTRQPPSLAGALAPALSGRRELTLFLRRLGLLGGLIVVLILLGTLGFVLTEGSSVWHGFIWTLDTVATVGSIPEPSATGGQVVKVLLIVLGVGTLFYALVTISEFFVAGHLSGLLYERRVARMIERLSDHYLICGFGRVGQQVARDLQAAGASFVVIDLNPEIREAADEVGALLIEGAPSDDDILCEAGIERARALVACVDSDAENIFTTLTARELRSDITIVARASAEDSEKKLLRAGADRVISPYKASGTEMARLALHPQVSGVADVAPEYRLEEIEVLPGCAGAGRRVGEVRGGSMIIAVRRADGPLLPQPPEDTEIEPGDVVIALGPPQIMERLEELFASGARLSR